MMRRTVFRRLQVLANLALRRAVATLRRPDVEGVDARSHKLREVGLRLVRRRPVTRLVSTVASGQLPTAFDDRGRRDSRRAESRAARHLRQHAGAGRVGCTCDQRRRGGEQRE